MRIVNLIDEHQHRRSVRTERAMVLDAQAGNTFGI